MACFRVGRKLIRSNVCTIRLINKTRHRAAFKVLTVPYFVKRCIVTPSTGIVEPGSTYEVSVTIQEEEKLASPVEFVAVPKFAIFSTVISEGEDITSETFLNEGGKKVWLKVIDVVHDEQSRMLEVNLRRHGSVLRFLVLVAAVVAVFIGWVLAFYQPNNIDQIISRHAVCGRGIGTRYL
ncbi:vesicle-associated protein 2-2-like protein isoform X1 [Tanacetum coccineum]